MQYIHHDIKSLRSNTNVFFSRNKKREESLEKI